VRFFPLIGYYIGLAFGHIVANFALWIKHQTIGSPRITSISSYWRLGPTCEECN